MTAEGVRVAMGGKSIAQFLGERYQETEARIQMIRPEHRSWLAWVEGRDGKGGEDCLIIERYAWTPGGWPDEATLDHAAAHDPASVLADLESKRAIIALYERAYETGDEQAWFELSDVLRLLARPYRDHPEFQEGWGS